MCGSFHTWSNLPKFRFFDIPELYWLVSKNEYQSKTWSKIFLKNPILSVQQNEKKLSPSHEYSQILLGDSHVHWGVTTPLDFLKPISRPSPSHLLKGPKCQAVNCRWNFWGEPGQSQPHGDYVCSSRSSKVDAFVLREKVGAEKCLVETACYKSSSSSLSQQNKTHILDAAYQPFRANSLKPCNVFP